MIEDESNSYLLHASTFSESYFRRVRLRRCRLTLWNAFLGVTSDFV